MSSQYLNDAEKIVSTVSNLSEKELARLKTLNGIIEKEKDNMGMAHRLVEKDRKSGKIDAVTANFYKAEIEVDIHKRLKPVYEEIKEINPNFTSTVGETIEMRAEELAYEAVNTGRRLAKITGHFIRPLVQIGKAGFAEIKRVTKEEYEQPQKRKDEIEILRDLS